MSGATASVAGAEPLAQATPAAQCVAPSQGVVVEIQAPNPNDVVQPGSNVVVQGIAYDTSSTAGPGIDRVSVYFGDRDAGGLFWGNAALGLANPQGRTDQLSSAGFSLRSPTIPSGSGNRSIFVYAHSSLTNREGSASVPVFLGAAPTPARGQAPTAVVAAAPTCTPVPTPTVAATATPRPAPPAPAVAPAAAVASASPLASTPAVPVVPAPPAAAAQATAQLVTPAVAAQPTSRPAALTTPTSATAPRGGGIPAALGWFALGAGAAVLGGGYALRRRERRSTSHH